MRIDAIKAIIQHSSTLYYPIVISAEWSSTFPYSCPVATVKVHTETDSGESSYTTVISSGDVIRLQTSTKLKTNDNEIWEDAFEGRIENVFPSYKEGDNTTTFQCVGHAHDTNYSMVTADEDYAFYNTGEVIDDLIAYLSRLSDKSPSLIDTTNSTDMDDYNIQDDTRYVADVIRDCESVEGWGYRFTTETAYSSGLYSACYVSWQPISTTAIDTLKIIEGTRRYISGDFQNNMDRLVNDCTVYGGTGTQVSGSDDDAVSIAAYGRRRYVYTMKGFTTDYICGLLAEKIVDRWKDPVVIGTVVITGENMVYPGDYVYVNIPSITLGMDPLSGLMSVDGDYLVRSVSHTFSANGWMTKLDLGEISENSANLIAQLIRESRLNNSNFVD